MGIYPFGFPRNCASRHILIATSKQASLHHGCKQSPDKHGESEDLAASTPLHLIILIIPVYQELGLVNFGYVGPNAALQL